MARVLVADDEPGIREFLVGCLATEGHRITQAGSGDEALARLRDEAFDVVLTDLKMPGADGISVVEHALAQQPEVQVIVLTAHGSVETAVKAMKLGAFDYIEKPVASPAALRLVVARALERRRLLDREEQARRQDVRPRLTWGDPAMTSVVKQLEKVAVTDATVLLLGESGVGKEVAAGWIHDASRRRGGPFVAINCASLSEPLPESELFGHEKGAFTGAATRKRGLVELAHGGTFFLDEVGELRPELQARLLRVLQERRFERVGGTQSVEVDVRWIAATNRDLRARATAGTFRDDLYHRLAVFPVRIPALRDRPTDIAPLAEDLLVRIAARLGRSGLALTAEARALLVAAPWLGNVRELANVLERAAILCDGATIEAEHVLVDAEPEAASVPGSGGTLDDLERRAIAEALAAVDGNRRRAAERLGIGLRTLYDKLRRYRL